MRLERFIWAAPWPLAELSDAVIDAWLTSAFGLRAEIGE